MAEAQNQNNVRRSWEWIFGNRSIGNFLNGGAEISNESEEELEEKAKKTIMALSILQYLDGLHRRPMTIMFILWARRKDLSDEKIDELSFERVDECLRNNNEISKWWMEKTEDSRRKIINSNLNNIFTAWLYGRACGPILYRSKFLAKWISEIPSERIERQNECFGAFCQYIDEIVNETRVKFSTIQEDITENEDDIIKLAIGSILKKLKEKYGKTRETALLREIFEEVEKIEDISIKNRIKEILNKSRNRYKDRRPEADKNFLTELNENREDNVNIEYFEAIFIRRYRTIKDRICTILGLSQEKIQLSFRLLRLISNKIEDDKIRHEMNKLLDNLENRNGIIRTRILLKEIIIAADTLVDEANRDHIKELLDKIEKYYIQMPNLPLEDEGRLKDDEEDTAKTDDEIIVDDNNADEAQRIEDQVLFHNAYLDNNHEEYRAKIVFAYWLKVNIIDQKLATQTAIVNAFKNVYRNGTNFSRLLEEGQGIMDGRRINQDIQDKNFL